MNEDEFRQLVGDATAFLRSQNARAHGEFGIRSYQRYDYDLRTNKFWWSDDGVPQVEARVIVVGSISTQSKTWLWSWGNPHFEGVRSPEIERVREYGVEQGIPPLVQPKWPADEIDGWEMTSVSARLLESSAAYRSPDEDGSLFLLLNDLKRLGPTSIV